MACILVLIFATLRVPSYWGLIKTNTKTMSTNRKYNKPQDIDFETLVEVVDLFVDFLNNYDPSRLKDRFLEFFGCPIGYHQFNKLGKNPTPSDFIKLYREMSFVGREQFLKVVVSDRYEVSKDYLTALPLDHRSPVGTNPIFAPFESLAVAFDTLAQKDMILAGQLAQTLTDLTAISYRREGVQS